MLSSNTVHAQATCMCQRIYRCHGRTECDKPLRCCRCLEGRFDTFGTLGIDMSPALVNGNGIAPPSIGLGNANLSEPVHAFLQEVALSEQVVSWIFYRQALPLQLQSSSVCGASGLISKACACNLLTSARCTSLPQTLSHT